MRYILMGCILHFSVQDLATESALPVPPPAYSLPLSVSLYVSEKVVSVSEALAAEAALLLGAGQEAGVLLFYVGIGQGFGQEGLGTGGTVERRVSGFHYYRG